MTDFAFNPPPNWPIERGWKPTPDWRPDPAWGPAPQGWPFWVEVVHGDDQRESAGTLPTTKDRVSAVTRRVKDAAGRAAASDLTKDIASKAKDVAKDERTMAALKVAGALVLGAAVTKHYRDKGQSVPDSVDQMVKAAKNSSRSVTSRKSREVELVPSDPFEVRLGWSTVGTLLKHPDHPKLWLEASMAGIQHYVLAVEWGDVLPRTMVEIGDVPKQWTRMQVGKTVLPVALCRTSNDTITFVWLSEPYDLDAKLGPAPSAVALPAVAGLLRLSCPCGVKLHGSDHDELYDAAATHARDAHQMSASRSAVIAAATRVVRDQPTQASPSRLSASTRAPENASADGSTDPLEVKRRRELEAKRHAATKDADYAQQMQDLQDAARHAQFLSNQMNLQHQTSMAIIRNIR